MGRERVLLHSAWNHFGPCQMRASAATALLAELSRTTEGEATAAA